MLDKAKKGLTAAQRAAGQVYDEAKDRAEGAYEIGRNTVEGVYDGIRDKVTEEPAKILTSWCSWLNAPWAALHTSARTAS